MVLIMSCYWIFYISHSLGKGQEELLNVVNEMKRKMEDIDYNVKRMRLMSAGNTTFFTSDNETDRGMYIIQDSNNVISFPFEAEIQQ